MKISPVVIYKVLGAQIRLRLVVLIQDQQTLCVSDLVHALRLPQPKVSGHLALLKNSGLLITRRIDQRIYYLTNPELPEWAVAVLNLTRETVHGHLPYTVDRRRILTREVDRKNIR